MINFVTAIRRNFLLRNLLRIRNKQTQRAKTYMNKYKQTNIRILISFTVQIITNLT